MNAELIDVARAIDARMAEQTYRKCDANIPLGLVRDLPANQYHADRSVSNTMLSAMHKSPAHCYALHLAPGRPQREATPAMMAGTLAHTAILEPEELALRYVAKPPGMRFSTKEGIAWRDQQTSIIVTQDELDTAKAQRAAVLKVRALGDLLASGESEVSMFWDDHLTGLRCRARADWLHWTGRNRAIALDIKTISDLTQDSVRRAIGTYGYHRQAAHYLNGLRACGVEVEEFVFGFVSSSYPFLAVAYLLDEESLQQGHDEIAELTLLYAYCQERNEWPAFGDGYQLTSLPGWAKRTSEVEIDYA